MGGALSIHDRTFKRRRLRFDTSFGITAHTMYNEIEYMTFNFEMSNNDVLLFCGEDCGYQKSTGVFWWLSYPKPCSEEGLKRHIIDSALSRITM